MYSNDSKRQVYFIFHIHLLSGSHCIYNIWPSRGWPSSKTDSGLSCYQIQHPACSYTPSTTLLWRKQETAIQNKVSSWPSIKKNKTFLYGWVQLDYRGETYKQFLQLKAGTFMLTGVAGISVANINKHLEGGLGSRSPLQNSNFFKQFGLKYDVYPNFPRYR